jgi:SMI1-KNR4 cell-wall
MTADQLRDVEHELNLTLPKFYAAFMLEYPQDLNDTVIQIGDSPQIPADWEFIGSSERLIEVNRFVREPEVEWLEDGGPWPDDQFVIGEDIGGDYFSVNLSGTSEAVLMFDHETGGFEPCAASLSAHAQRVIAEYSRYNANR